LVLSIEKNCAIIVRKGRETRSKINARIGEGGLNHENKSLKRGRGP